MEAASAAAQNHGITDESFEAIQTVTASEVGLTDQQCAICMGDFAESERLKVLPCSELHAFHEECIQQWLSKQSSCPLCRNECGVRREPPPAEPTADTNMRGMLPLEDLLVRASLPLTHATPRSAHDAASHPTPRRAM